MINITHMIAVYVSVLNVDQEIDTTPARILRQHGFYLKLYKLEQWVKNKGKK